MPASSSALSSPSTHAWGAVLAMSLCSFALVASEFMPVSLLTPIATDLHLSEGQAGQAISISGIFAVITSLFIASATQRIDRKKVLLVLTALMVGSGVLVVCAPNYPSLMVGRALLGVAIGGCWSMSTAVMMRIAAEAMIPRAIAMLQGGSALATAVAAPLGSFMGSLIGWRGAFFCVVPLAAIALVWQALTLPSLPPSRNATGAGATLALLARPHMVTGMAALALLFMGQFALFTYLRPFLETVTLVNVDQLSMLLLGIGVAGLLGTTLVGLLLGQYLHSVLIAIPLLMAVITIALIAFGHSMVLVGLLLAAWGLIATSAPVGWFTWLSKTLPEDAEAGGGLMVAVIQLAITLGATVGGLLYDGLGYQATFIASAVMLVAATLFTLSASRGMGTRH
jgi:predicted MFS family arabinose efflux permease